MSTAAPASVHPHPNLSKPGPGAAPVTAALVEKALGVRYDALPADVVALAKQCLLDWYAVTLAAWDDPLVKILVDDAAEEGGRQEATLVGRGAKVARIQAALINGAASHALDYDDVNLTMSGHPTVTFTPALLALAEGRKIGGKAFLEAFVAGYETSGRVGALVAPSHYRTGFHATGTVGSFASAAACARLLGLDAKTAAIAFGIAATQASGLKSMFGTDCKPLHAGLAAKAGLTGARLAQRGFSARPDSLECAQGFADTHGDDFNPDKAIEDPVRGFHIRNNLFKYHAACYLTHAPMECVKALRLNSGLAAEDVRRINLRIDRDTDAVCNIQKPTTGLEAKFSLKLTTAFALAGVDTASMDAYSAANANDPKLAKLRDKVEIDFQSGWPHSLAEMTVELNDGRTLEMRYDSGVPERDVDAQGAKIVAKYRALATPVLGAEKTERLLERVQKLDTLDDIDLMVAASVR